MEEEDIYSHYYSVGEGEVFVFNRDLLTGRFESLLDLAVHRQFEQMLVEDGTISREYFFKTTWTF